MVQRLRGRRVRFVTGTDEHGEKIALAAAKRGLSPQEHCDGIVAEYKSLWEKASSICACVVTRLHAISKHNCIPDIAYRLGYYGAQQATCTLVRGAGS